MPNYDLYCPDCAREFRIHASMTEKSEKRIPCPNCGSIELETMFKAPPAYVKGPSLASCPNKGGCGVSCPRAG